MDHLGDKHLLTFLILLFSLPGALCQLSSTQLGIVLAVVGVVCLGAIVTIALVIICCCVDKKKPKRAARSARQTKVTPFTADGGEPTAVESMPRGRMFNQNMMFNIDYNRMFGAAPPYQENDNQNQPAAGSTPDNLTKKKQKKPKKLIGGDIDESSNESSDEDTKNKKKTKEETTSKEQKKEVKSPPPSTRDDIKLGDFPLTTSPFAPGAMPADPEPEEVIETPFGLIEEKKKKKKKDYDDFDDDFDIDELDQSF